MATTASTVFGTSTAITITIASLAASSTLLVGQNATAVDVSAIATVPIDIMIGGSIMTGTTPTAGLIQVYASGTEDGSNYPGSIATTNGAQTLTAETKGLLRLVANMSTNTTSNQAYTFSPVSLASLFGGVLPRRMNFWLTHSTVAALNATGGNQLLKYTPINYLST